MVVLLDKTRNCVINWIKDYEIGDHDLRLFLCAYSYFINVIPIIVAEIVIHKFNLRWISKMFHDFNLAIGWHIYVINDPLF